MKRQWAIGVLWCGLVAAPACGGDGPSQRPDTTADTAASDIDESDLIDKPDIASDIAVADVQTDDTTTSVRGCVAAAAPDPAGTNTWSDSLGTATVSMTHRDTCARTYTLTTSALLRDASTPNPRVVSETANRPVLRSGNDLFDTLYALAVAEVAENAVAAVSDGAFNDGAAVPCGDGGCFETGRLWKYVWTRDIAFSVHLGLADLDIRRSENSLRFKLSERRAGGDVQIVQDTGTGGSWPVSTDRVAWALGAEALLDQLSGEVGEAFAAAALAAISHTIAHDRATIFDPEDGIYRGETSFLDWREQTYPEWTAADVVHIGMSKALSTNLLHYQAFRLAARLSQGAEATTYARQASELSAAIHQKFWKDDLGLFASYATTTLDPAAVDRFDLLGSSLAVILGVASEAEAGRILASYPHVGAAAPVIWPQQQQTPIYHNRGQWPFVTAYWLRAAAKAGNDAVADRMVRALVRGAAINLSHMENFEVLSGSPYLEDGDASGPVVNSERQLWSVAGYISMVHHTLFGLHPEAAGLRIRPFIPASLRTALFGGSRELTLYNYRWQEAGINVTLRLPETAGTGALRVGAMTMNERPLSGGLLTAANLGSGNTLVIELQEGEGASSLREVQSDDWRQLYGPRTPRISSVFSENGQVVLDLTTPEPDDTTLDIYRDGALAAEGLAGTTSRWMDPSFDANSSRSPCYAVAARFTASGNASQHSPPVCFWGADNARVKSFGVGEFTHNGGNPTTTAGRFHYEAWGDEGHSLTSPSFVATQTGPALFQLVYGNGAGGVTTGVTAAFKRLTVFDVTTNAPVTAGYVLMPHLGDWARWSDSSFVPATLEAGETYRVVIDGDSRAINMSFFKHFESYTGGLGGREGAHNRVNITELKVLYR